MLYNHEYSKYYSNRLRQSRGSDEWNDSTLRSVG